MAYKSKQAKLLLTASSVAALAGSLGLSSQALAENVINSNSYQTAEEICAEVQQERNGRRESRRVERNNEARKIECNPNALPLPNYGQLTDAAPIPDRWRVIESTGFENQLVDPYGGNNPLKGDVPVWGEDWFVSLQMTSDSVIEPRRFPIAVGAASTNRIDSLDTVGRGQQFLFNENLLIEAIAFKGDTVFRPPDWEMRFTPVINYNQTHVDEIGVLKVDPTFGRTRREGHIGIQSLFIDKHLRNVSDRYDFDSLRVGVQPFSSDFRGFLFQDQQLGIRLFGTRANNIFQYNLAWFRRMEKDTNSGLNDLGEQLRDDDVFIANLYWQDLFKLGFVSQFTVVHNRNREKKSTKFDDNGFIARPASLALERNREYDVTYFGYNGDGHFDRLNVTTSLYHARGRESNGTFSDEEQSIDSWFGALEISMDFDYIRTRFSAAYASGDDDPFDDRAQGFDAIFENPQFAGSDTSFWIRQPVPFIFGGNVAISSRNGMLNNLRSTKELGQSNFTNPGLKLLGFGADFDLTPKTRLTFNINRLWFDRTESLEAARNQASIDNDIGTDVSLALIYRPLLNQNIVIRLSGAVLVRGQGFQDIFGQKEANPYSLLANVIFTY